MQLLKTLFLALMLVLVLAAISFGIWSIAEGKDDKDSSNSTESGIVLIGGVQYLDTIELYRPSNTSKILNLTLSSGRQQHAAVLLDDGKVQIMGGMTQKDGYTTSTELLTKDLTQITPGPEMTTKRVGLASAKLNNHVYACGGKDETLNELNSCEVYNGFNWTVIEPMFHARKEFALISTGNSLLAIGGYNGIEGSLSSVEKYSPENGTWLEVEEMKQKRYRFGAAEMGGDVFVCGGSVGTSDALKSCEKYKVDEDRWMMIANVTRERTLFDLVGLDGKLYALGGNSNGTKHSVESYDLKGDLWEIEMDLKAERSASSAVVVPV